MTSIDAYAFVSCSGLTSVTIPDTVTIVSYHAFAGCSSLTDVYYAGSEASWENIYFWTGNECLADATVHFAEKFGENLAWTLDGEETLTIFGTGAIPAYQSGDAPWYSKRTSITNVVLKKGVTSIGDSAFYACLKMKTISVPEGVTSIGCSAFNGCNLLTSVTIPSSVTDIGNYAFANCTSLTDVYFKGSKQAWERIAIVNEDLCLTGVTLHLPVPGTCSGSMGMHMVAENKHVCDFCSKIVTECTDTGKNHVCNICGGTVGEHKATEGSHICDYCGKVASDCIDIDPVDHKCDVCGATMGEHKAAEGSHICDYCGKTASDCVDTNPVDHKCDICGTAMGEHKATEGSHNCAYCGQPASSCVDEDPKDHNCDICGNKLSDCIDEDGDGKCDICGAELSKPETSDVTRVAGAGRWGTAIKVADELKATLGVEKFDAIIVASGNNFADALAGSYLSTQKSAPILLSWGQGGKYAYLDTNNIDYIKDNLASGGTVYILGGTSAVPTLYEDGLAGYSVKRLGGGNRFETNQKILNEVGVAPGSEVLVCTAYNFADSLSASATGKPVLLVYTTDNGKNYGVDDAFLQNLKGCEFTIIGGKSAVSTGVEEILQSYGSVDRLAGGNRFETSVMVAERYFANPDSAVVAYAWNYPDGLCGGALAYAMKAPLILTMENWETAAVTYARENNITTGYVLGGEKLVPDNIVREIFSMDPSDTIR